MAGELDRFSFLARIVGTGQSLELHEGKLRFQEKEKNLWRM